ncbi:dihydroorotase [Calycomorphotria hydatis]|uniref:Dihydroorotase n=1 Tax=Calycomorphotria hydatis TaxID=2528027 RepID=A0A517T9I4_9PLAN|nr:dihydroorotase [Calycomorphotria hydatis]QDT65026.1 Dihydroorotase [Calycomorphotria hydatis]
MAETTVVRGGRVIDPLQGIDRIADLIIQDGKIKAITNEVVDAEIVIDAIGMIVAPGLVDPHVSFREPGDESDETTASGSLAALAGGFTSVACLPDTHPAVDTRAAAEFLKLQAERAGNCRVYPLGAVTKGLEGKELSEIGQLVDGGTVGFTDGKRSLGNAEIMRRALQYAGMFDKPILSHPQVPELVADGVMHEGFHSTVLGLRGMPAAAEYIMVARDIALAEVTGSHIHMMCISTAGSVEAIRQAKARGVNVTCDVTPHHLTLTDEVMRTFDSRFKVDPPLRTSEQVHALIAGLTDGTIDAIASDHQPYAEEKKHDDIIRDPFGVSGIESAFAICGRTLVAGGHLTWPQLIDKMACGPSNILGLPPATFTAGSAADVMVFDPEVEWTIRGAFFHSKGHSTPFEGMSGQGRVMRVLVDGTERFTHREALATLS